MVWWQIALLLLGALALAILGGIFLGRFFLGIRSKNSRREIERNRQLSEYIETRKTNSKTGILSLEEALQKKLRLENNTSDKKPDLQVSQTNSTKFLSENIQRQPLSIPKTIPAFDSFAAEEQIAKERAERAAKGVESLAKIEAALRIKEAKNREKLEMDHKVRETTTLNTKVADKVINQKYPEVKQHNTLQKACLDEIHANLKIATTPWTGTPLQFVTSTMDKNPDQFDSLKVQNHDDLREAYTDMAMANNIVWLVTELGTNSKELEESYVKLCAKVAERLHKILQDNP
jgi:hypothetical protein